MWSLFTDVFSVTIAFEVAEKNPEVLDAKSNKLRWKKLHSIILGNDRTVKCQ